MNFVQSLAQYLDLEESDPKLKMYEWDLDNFKLLMQIFPRDEIQSARRVISNLHKDMGGDSDGAYRISHSAGLIFSLLKPLHRDTFKRKTVNQKARNKSVYKNWVIAVKFRDGNKCRLCGTVHDLQVHHIKSVRENPDLITDFNNGITVCHSCHLNVHSLSDEEYEVLSKGWSS